MLCYACLEIESKNAKEIVDSLKPDDPSWCKCWAEDKIIIEIHAEKVSSLLLAIDDYLMHIKMAESICEFLY